MQLTIKVMEHYNEFCDFITSALEGLNVQVSGNACNIGFADISDQIAVTIVYSSSISVQEDGEIPIPSDSIKDIITLRKCLCSRLISSKFKLEAIDYIQFNKSAVGAGARWQLRFRRN